MQCSSLKFTHHTVENIHTPMFGFAFPVRLLGPAPKFFGLSWLRINDACIVALYLNRRGPNHEPQGVMFLRTLNAVFDDKRIMVSVVWCWLIVVLGVFTSMGLLKSDFVRFGPSPTTMYVGTHLDTWERWSAVAVFTAISSFMNDFAGESLEPFFLMVLRDHKTRYIPYSKATSVLLNQAWTLYCSIMSVFGLYTYFAQVDLLVIKMIVALIVNLYSSWRYLRNKQHEPDRYMKYFEHGDEDDENSPDIVGELVHEQDFKK